MQSIYVFLLAITLSIVATSGHYSNKKDQPDEFDYVNAWKEVQKLEDQQLPESALKIVNNIYEHAKSGNNSPQLIKAVIHILKYTEYKEEDSYIKNLNRLETEVRNSTFPAKPILHSMLAEIYWNYYQNNRYRFNQRTSTEGFDNNDISTWSLDKIVEETIKNYQLSLEQSDRLKRIKLDSMEDILLESNEKGRTHRPTLYDFLAHRAVDFYSNQEPDISRPAYTFTINSKDYLEDAGLFSKLEITTEDSLSHKYFALKIYQDLISFHLSDEAPEALFDIDLKRIQFVYQHLTLPDKQELYLKALESLEKKYIRYPVSTIATYHIAVIWREKGGKYQPRQSEEHKWEIKKAFDLCQAAVDRFPESEGAAMAFNLQNEIKVKTLSAQIEKVNVPQKPFRALVKYRNFSDLHWRIIKVDREEVRKEREKWINDYNVDREQKFLEHFVAKTPGKSGRYTLENDGDFQEHGVEVKVDALGTGDYMVIFSAEPDFEVTKNGMCYAFTTISNLSYIHRNLDDGSTEMYVLNRTTGETIEGADVQVMFQTYNRKKSNYELAMGKKYLTDESGRALIPNQKEVTEDYYYGAFMASITWQNDQIDTRDIDENYYGYSGRIGQYAWQKPQTRELTVFFLDRAIYRPGQTLHFKGLFYRTDGTNPEILPNRTKTVTLYDVNYQVVAQKEVTTNEYGTFNGTFTTPTSGLTGQMYLRIDDSNTTQQVFRVEEYKRPKFEVKFESVKGSYRLNDTVMTEGKAVAYSGTNIDGANVSYRVVRQARFPFWYWCWRGYYPSSPEMEITNGTTETDGDGKFEIKFRAIPDESVDKSSSPTFDYIVYADVTDINGETHTGQQTVSVGYKSLLVSVEIGDLDKSEDKIGEKKFKINTTNLAGEFQPANGSIKIWKLRSPEKAYRERMWEQPDRFVMNEEGFRQYFPNDLYKDENNFYQWEKEKEALSIQFNTAQEKDFSIKNPRSWKDGKYMLEIASQDKGGEEVKEVAYFDVYDSGSGNLAYPIIFKFQSIKTTCEPGETGIVQVGSSESVTALYEIERDGRIIHKESIELNDEKRMIEIPVKEEYRGNIAMHLTFVKHNRLYNQSAIITVPYTNKQLDIQFETFRDKLQPGQEEQWKIKISPKKADKVMAEMVATLYDASLDVFVPHNWSASFYSSLYARLNWASQNGFVSVGFQTYDRNWNDRQYKQYIQPYYDALDWFGLNLYSLGRGYYYLDEVVMESAADVAFEPSPATVRIRGKSSGLEVEEDAVLNAFDENESTTVSKKELTGAISMVEKSGSFTSDFSNVKIRSNFNETAFFYPDLQTNEKGEIIINFTIPEALTRWKMLGFAHTKDLKYGLTTRELVTQKELMVVPNQPRFFRENDKMIFSAKINNLSEKQLSGESRLEFFDGLTMKSIDSQMGNGDNMRSFQMEAGQSTSVEWNIEIPEGVQAITYRIVAKAGNFSDGEEMIIPVVTNRMLVTESLPLPIRGNQTKTYTFDKLVNSSSTTLRNHRYTLEFTSNPAWYAVQALPYLMEYPYECTEQTFSRYYANSIATNVANSNPKIKRVFDTWATIQPDALLSNLEKNQELKSALLEETPWVLQAKSESQRKRNIALLFDLNRMANEQERALKKVMDAQSGNGGFSWFPGFPEDRYITQHIVAGLGHLDVLGVNSVREDPETWQMLERALNYLDSKIADHYEYLKSEAKKGHLKLEEYQPGYTDIHYLYTRSYFKEVDIRDKYREGQKFFLEQCKKYWSHRGIYMQGMVALALHRNNETKVTQSIIRSLDERALHSEEMGMYWKQEEGYFWYQAPIETQALMIEVYDEVANDIKAVEELKIWLLKQKQTQDWKTTKATSEAVYALLRRGSDALASDNLVEITVGDEKIDPRQREDVKVEAGTGYFKTAWIASEISSNMGNIKVEKKDEGVAWGAVYWQYFEQLDKITPAETPLKLNKHLFLQKNTDRGPVISPITEKTELHVGDLVKVRIELRVDRDMEYIHLKDMRAAGFEPVETLSKSKYQDGLYYYESPRDLATNFFIGWLPKGTYVFEYPLRVSQRGDFSNGITTIQCMYAPEFSSHSEGVRVKVD